MRLATFARNLYGLNIASRPGAKRLWVVHNLRGTVYDRMIGLDVLVILEVTFYYVIFTQTFI